MTLRLTARQIVTDALQLIGKFGINDAAADGHAVARGLDWLDGVLSELMAERWVVQLTGNTPVSIQLEEGRATYDLAAQVGPVDGIIYPLTCMLVQGGSRRDFRLVRLDEWESLRGQSYSPGLPMFGHLDRRESATLRVYPTPGASPEASLELQVATYPPTVAARPNRANDTGNVSIGLRPEWNLWAKYQLAYHLGNGPVVKLPLPERAELLAFATRSKELLFAYAAREMEVQPPICDGWEPDMTPRPFGPIW